jgi:hypothetical protein
MGRFETQWLAASAAWRSRTILRRLAADNPAYGRIMREAYATIAKSNTTSARLLPYVSSEVVSVLLQSL